MDGEVIALKLSVTGAHVFTYNTPYTNMHSLK